MGLIQAIIRFFKGLFGLNKPAQPALPGANAAASAASAAAPAAEEEEDYARQEWKEMQAFIARCEAQGLDLAGMDVNDPLSYWQKLFAIEEAESRGEDRDQVIAAQGFANADHWEQASHYVMYKWSELITNEDGELEVRQKDAFTNGALQARQGQMQAQLAADEAADPSVLEPVEGVTLEAWAAAAAGITKLPQNATPDQLNQHLAQHGMDRALYDRVNAEWTRRMSQDTTMVISNKYAAAFSGSLGVTAGGAEPVPFERYVEVMVAQEAWAASGMDVNAQLKVTFGIDAATYGSWGMYWGSKMSTDVAMMQKYDSLRDRYLQKYQSAGLDDDLSL